LESRELLLVGGARPEFLELCSHGFKDLRVRPENSDRRWP
jgi:hypothetical protein